MGNASQKSTIDTHTKKKKQSKHSTEDNHQIKREMNKRRREEKRPTKTNPKQESGTKNIHINNYLKYNGLNGPTKRHRLAEEKQKQDLYICCI